MRYILINGQKRSGKDFFASRLKAALEKQGKTVQIESFANPLKDIISISLGISREDLDRYKNNNTNIITEDKIITDYRVFLQRFGTEGMKKYFGNSVWVDLIKQKTQNNKTDYAIVPDFRFPEEEIENCISIFVKNDSNPEPQDSHASENSLKDFDFDFTIDNTGYGDITEDINIIVSNIMKL